MWRWVTRGLVLSVFVLLSASTLVAQTTTIIGAVDSPDPGTPQTGMVLVKGWLLDPSSVSKAELYVDDQFQYDLQTGLPRIDVELAYPNYPGIQNVAPGFQTGFRAARFSNGPHTVSLKVVLGNGQVVNDFGRRTITIDNTLPQSPFGSLDIPDESATFNATGSFPIVGWVTDTDGVAKVDVYVDNAILQAALKASNEVLIALRDNGSLEQVSNQLASFEQRQQSVAKDSWDELERRYETKNT